MQTSWDVRLVPWRAPLATEFEIMWGKHGLQYDTANHWSTIFSNQLQPFRCIWTYLGYVFLLIGFTTARAANLVATLRFISFPCVLAASTFQWPHGTGRLGGIGSLGQCTESHEHFHIISYHIYITDIASGIEHRQESNQVYAWSLSSLLESFICGMLALER